jgi:hypothetical protein
MILKLWKRQLKKLRGFDWIKKRRNLGFKKSRLKYKGFKLKRRLKKRDLDKKLKL